MTTPAGIASQFAASLDAEEYPLTLSCLADDCVYESPTGELAGPAAIVDSYKGFGEDTRRLFDAISYRHEIVPLGENWYRIAFIDELSSGNRSHVFRCNQRVFVDKGRINRIIHEEIPGQRERLNAFLESLG